MPGPFAADIYVAFCKLYNDQHPHSARSSESREVIATFTELADLMQISRGGKTWKLIRENLSELKQIPIYAVQTFREGKYAAQKKEFNIFSEVTYLYTRDGNEADTTVRVELSKTVAQSIASGYFRLLDTTLYFTLPTPTAKRLYRYLDVRRWRGSEELLELTLPMRELVERLPVQKSAQSQVRQTLDPAHEELVKAGYLAALPEYLHDDAQGRSIGAYSIRYVFADENEADRVPAGGARDDNETHSGEQSALQIPAALPEREPQDLSLGVLVQDILEVLRDEHSIAFYVKAAKLLPEPVVRGLLGSVRVDLKEGKIRVEDARRMFTASVKRRAKLLDVEL